MSQADHHAAAAGKPRPIPRPAAGMWLFAGLTLGLITLTAACSVVGFVFSGERAAELLAYGTAVSDVRTLQQGLIDAQSGVRGFLVNHRVEYLQPYFTGISVVDARGPEVLPMLDSAVSEHDPTAEPHPVSRRIAELRKRWAEVIALADAPATFAAVPPPARLPSQLMEELRGYFAAYLAQRDAAVHRSDARLALERRAVLAVELAGALIAALALLYAFARSIRDIHAREAAIAEREQTGHRLELLFGMTNTLQSLTDREDAHQVLRATAMRLLPGFAGMLYGFNNSQDRLDLALAWGTHGDAAPPDHITPGTCWAMKRGKPHQNSRSGERDGALRCLHVHAGDSASLELPMAARGQVFGLLLFSHPGPDADSALQAALPIAAAMADALSMALSSLALREMLRNQALRDALTGLYNRRFLDEMLAHLTLEARRRQTTLSAIMIDLDHFKQLNDQYGHATGDAVLREVASVVTQSLRATDIACRYGGEELAILLPDCPLEMAMFKAEQLRGRIAEVAPGPVGAAVTASLGVGALPDTSSDPAGLLASADAALYRAKIMGRNRVVQAERHQLVAPPPARLESLAEA